MRATNVQGRDDWDQHWGAHVAANALNPAQVYRQQLVFTALRLGQAPRPVRVLELGSGSGEMAAELTARFPQVEILGLDLSAVGLELARRKVPGGQFIQQDFTRPIALPDSFRGWATHVICSEVLEHLDEPVAMLRHVRPFLAPGCRLVITVPAGPMSAFDRHIGHRGHFTAKRIEAVLRDAGLEVAEVQGAGFPFFNLYRLTVIARGKRLIADAAGSDPASLPLAARVAIRAFSWLFRLNTDRARLGWQLVAVGLEPG
ncbi:MAG: class I SAM-dependent methyltransferase [Myxococcales bacterium]|nr:class I SAM-dependent methyltransferase [Myxococcales bacterium]